MAVSQAGTCTQEKGISAKCDNVSKTQLACFQALILNRWESEILQLQYNSKEYRISWYDCV